MLATMLDASACGQWLKSSWNAIVITPKLSAFARAEGMESEAKAVLGTTALHRIFR